VTDPASARAPEPAASSLEQQVADAIAVCDGDVRAALMAALVYNSFLERKLAMMRGMISSGYARQRVLPGRAASARLDAWREVSSDAGAGESDDNRRANEPKA
jgi:hypothetical protein